ncbi:MAG: acylphosphatase [Candidatus Omnitrophica bacterium]|nr:acylphosphatase [Candidatus Omnitrophota bacterium]
MSYKQLHVFYSGSVQGVGFRYTARRIASDLGLTGWVRNLGDGRVEMVCEGEEKKLQRFLDDVIVDFHIKDTQISWQEPTQELNSFEIRF